MTDYVAGFMFQEQLRDVALIRKRRPDWQAGKLNGIGGHVEPGESFRAAMRREFREETGLDREDWEHFATVAGPWGQVAFYRATVLNLSALRDTTDEHIELVSVWGIQRRLDILPNLKWLIPFAAYNHDVYAPIFAQEVTP